jgi:hypothetical protein
MATSPLCPSAKAELTHPTGSSSTAAAQVTRVAHLSPYGFDDKHVLGVGADMVSSVIPSPLPTA